MKKSLTSLALTVALLAGGIGRSSADETPPVPAPRLEIEKTLIDLGQVVRGKTSPVVFELRNTGDAVLNILYAKPG